ncbi:hypothetical protein SADUNF_Sadunf02G0206400 [Salix dunnii]|uniref:Uncharacterized protein n=1 Tax=Salix dunnii TaxID=1413687 RepID=A0A835N9G7_9ROSI|nr:hypothetical protein SADUNF_Sadunf02G0206400 [Salix dunnii]
MKEILDETDGYVKIHNKGSNGIALCDKTKALYIILDRFIKDELEHLWHHPLCFEQIEGMSRFLDSLHYPLATIESSTKIKIDMHASQGKALCQRRLCHRHRIPHISVPTGPAPTLSTSSGASLINSPTTAN